MKTCKTQVNLQEELLKIINLDLTQVEAIADIVNAETEMQRKQAISHLSGIFLNLTKDIFENLKKILANIEAELIFLKKIFQIAFE